MISTELQSKEGVEEDLTKKEVKTVSFEENTQENKTAKFAKQEVKSEDTIVICKTELNKKEIERSFKAESGSDHSTAQIKLEETESAYQETGTATEVVQKSGKKEINEELVLVQKPVSVLETETIDKNFNSCKVVKNGNIEKPSTVLTGVKQVENYCVAVEVNVDVDDMSRKYSGLSSSRG